MSEKNYYEILEVSVYATKEEIAEAYNRAKTAYSSDGSAMYSIFDPEESKRILENIEEAFQILFNQDTRKKYDVARGFASETQAPKTPEIPSFAASLHGITTTQTDVSSFDTIQTPETPVIPQRETENKNSSDNINRLIAQKKFGLDFEVDENFEKEIEQTTEFTGEFLQRVREYRNVTIERLSEMTKISKTYLRAIEEENIDKLPAMVYIRGFIYQFAKCLKLNPDLVATSYIFRLKKIKEQNDK